MTANEKDEKKDRKMGGETNEAVKNDQGGEGAQ